MDEPEAPPESLADRIGSAVRGRRAIRLPRRSVGNLRSERWLAVTLALLIAGGPAATALGAWLLAGSADAETRAIEAEAAPRLAAARADAAARGTLAALLRRPSLGGTLEALARALPADAALTGAGRDAGGLLTVEVATPDPDAVRAALRREPMLAGLRDAGQRSGEGTMLVQFREMRP